MAIVLINAAGEPSQIRRTMKFDTVRARLRVEHYRIAEVQHPLIGRPKSRAIAVFGLARDETL